MGRGERAIRRRLAAAQRQQLGGRWAAAQAGILEVLDGLPLGLDTPLAAGYTDGTDLSGGQWQRVALARAFYALRAGTRILVLDEPTASLDVRGEAEFLDQFIELTQGVTTIVISHRFATVRHADQIVVLNGGRITEQGTHESLVADGGRYAELFRLQAERQQPGQDLHRDRLHAHREPRAAADRGGAAVLHQRDAARRRRRRRCGGHRPGGGVDGAELLHW